jgi:hypothetical protein
MAVAEIISAVGGVGVTVVDQGARRALEKKVNELSSAQQKELGDKLLTTQSNSERLRIVNDYLFKIRNQGASNKIAMARNIGIIIIGVGIISLAVVLIIYKKK